MEPWLRNSNTVLAGAFDAGAIHWANQDARQQAAGYDFHHPAVLQNVPPPTVTFDRPLRWWSLDRQRRRATAMRLRDRLLDDIMRAGGRNARDRQENQ